MRSFTDTVRTLNEASRRKYYNPYLEVNWPDSIDPDGGWYTSPELISLYGTSRWDQMSEAQRRRLSFWEAVNFFSLNIHGEKSLMSGLADRVDTGPFDAVSEYLHHFLDEENKHSIWFSTFCRRYAGKIYADRKVEFPRDHAEGEADFLFFARVAVFEEIVDRYNASMGRDNRLEPVARTINELHHADESRHLVFGRRIIEEMWGEWSPKWTAETIDGIRSYLLGYITSTWREYYNPDVYRDCGIDDPVPCTREAWDAPAQKEHRREFTESCLSLFQKVGVLTKEVSV